MKLWLIVGAAVVLASLVAGLVCLPFLPDTMAVHWGWGDQPDGFMPKVAAVIVIPAVSLLVLVPGAVWWGLSTAIKHAPYRRVVNLAALGTIVPLAFLLAYAQGITLVWNLGVHLPVGLYIVPALALLIVVIVLSLAPLMGLELAYSRAVGKSQPGLWFAAKRFGWGWGLPCAWQGWVVMVAWVVLLLAGVLGLLFALEGGLGIALVVVFVLVMVGIQLGLCLWKGERPRWRWGDDDPSGSS